MLIKVEGEVTGKGRAETEVVFLTLASTLTCFSVGMHS